MLYHWKIAAPVQVDMRIVFTHASYTPIVGGESNSYP